MPEDRVTITADASQYFDVLNRAGAAGDRFSRTGDRIGQGFIRGERVVRTATANIAGALTMSGDAATTALVAMQGLERVFQIGLGPTIAVAAGVKAFEVLHEAVQKTHDAFKDLKEELLKPIIPDAVTAESDAKIDELTKKVKLLQDQLQEPKSKTGGFLAGFLGIGAQAFLPQFLRGPTLSALSKLAPEGAGAVNPVLAGAQKRLDAFVDVRAQAILRAADKLHEALAEAVTRFRTSTGQLFHDIGSGQFLKDLHQRNADNVITKGGQEMAKGFEADIAAGIPLGPDAAAIVNASRQAAAKGGQDIGDVLNMDFSNLDVLSKYDFSGLAPLSGITIMIQ